MAGLRGKISHVVVLMLENRSFDNLLGKLYPSGPGFNGLAGSETNPRHDPASGAPLPPVPVWNDASLVPGTRTIPAPDPGELFTDITTQLYGLGAPPADIPPPMNGFVDNYLRQQKAPPYAPDATMHFYTPDQAPVLSALARQFAVCDQWHASAPNQTWPNRFFAHTASAGGYVDNSPSHFPYTMPTVFNLLESKGLPWQVYFHDLPQSLTLFHLWGHAANFRPFATFADDAAAGWLPAYSFLEPRYFADAALGMPNDQHPPHDITFAEQLIAKVYNALRAAPTWPETLFVITYDEHGGCFDHAPPPAALPPGDGRLHDDFAFDRFGVRVPAVIVSPYIAPGTILRSAPAGLPHRGPPFPYDHTSIIATLRKCFDLGAPLTARDGAAPDLDAVLTLETPGNNGLEAIAVPDYTPSAEDLQNAIGRPLSDLQIALHELACVLPASGVDLFEHAQRLQGQPPPPKPAGIREAVAVVRGALDRFFNRS